MTHQPPGLTVGAVEDAAKWAPDPAREMKAAHDAGFRAIVLSAVWQPGAPADALVPPLRRAVDAAVANDVQPVLAVYQLSSNTPLEPAARGSSRSSPRRSPAGCPTSADVIVGNEPNLNLFWQPQFDAERRRCGGDRLRDAARRDLRRAEGGRLRT